MMTDDALPESFEPGLRPAVNGKVVTQVLPGITLVRWGCFAGALGVLSSLACVRCLRACARAEFS